MWKFGHAFRFPELSCSLYSDTKVRIFPFLPTQVNSQIDPEIKSVARLVTSVSELPDPENE